MFEIDLKETLWARPFSILQFVFEYPGFASSRSTIYMKEFDNFVLSRAYSWGNG